MQNRLKWFLLHLNDLGCLFYEKTFCAMNLEKSLCIMLVVLIKKAEKILSDN